MTIQQNIDEIMKGCKIQKDKIQLMFKSDDLDNSEEIREEDLILHRLEGEAQGYLKALEDEKEFLLKYDKNINSPIFITKRLIEITSAIERLKEMT